jgi:hypothetical protein
LLGTCIAEGIPLTIEAGDEHGSAMFFATRLVTGDEGRIVPPWGGVAQGFVEASLTEFFRAAEKFDRIVHVEWGQQELHGPIVLVA